MSQSKQSGSSSLLNGRNFEDFIEAYLEFTDGHESTVRVRLWSIISVLAASLERKVFLDRGFYTLFPNMFIFIIGKSGIVKKSTSTAIAVDLFRQLDNANMMSERLTASSLVEQMTNSGSIYDHEGEKRRQAAMFAYASELSVFLVEVFGDITPLLTTLYDCIPADSSKPWVYHTMGRGKNKIFGPCLNILGASTQAWLKRCIPTSEMEGGFTSRIMFVVENDHSPILVAWPELDPKLEEIKLKLVEDLRRIHYLIGEYKPSIEAKEWFRCWYDNHMRLIVPHNNDPRISGYMARKGDHILKLGMIRAASLSDSFLLTQDHLQWALAQLEDIEPDWRNAFDGTYVRMTFSELRYKIGAMIKNSVKIKKVELKGLFLSRAENKEIDKALDELVGMGEITATSRGQDEFWSYSGETVN